MFTIRSFFLPSFFILKFLCKVFYLFLSENFHTFFFFGLCPSSFSSFCIIVIAFAIITRFSFYPHFFFFQINIQIGIDFISPFVPSWCTPSPLPLPSTG